MSRDLWGYGWRTAAEYDPLYFPGWHPDDEVVEHPDDPIRDDLGKAWIIGDGLDKRKEHIQRGAEIGPAQPHENLNTTEQWMRNMGHEFATRIHRADPFGGELLRGMMVHPDWIDNVAQNRSVTLPLSSVDEDPTIASCYTVPHRDQPDPGSSVFMAISPGAKAYPFGDDRHDTEYLTHGDFDVHEMYPATSQEQDQYGINPGTMFMRLRQRHVPAPAGTHTAARLASNEPPVVMWHPDDVENYSIPDNPIYGGNLPDLKDSITQNGIQRPLAIHTDGDHAVLADGHHRLMAAQELGLHEVPVQVHYGAFDFDEDDDPEADEIIHKHLDQHHPGWRRGRSARLAMPSWYHLTDDPDFQLDPSKVPTNLNYYDLGAGVFLTQRPEEWASSSASPAWPSDWEDDDEWNGDRPYVAEIDAPDDLHKLPGTKYAPDAMRPHDMPGSEEIFVPADQYHHLTVKNVRSRNAQPQTWKAKIMTAAVTVYTKPNCPQCDMTKKQLDKLGIDHDTVDVTQDPDAHAYVTGLGYSSAPVVVVNDGESHWSGFRPDHLRGLIE